MSSNDAPTRPVRAADGRPWRRCWRVPPTSQVPRCPERNAWCRPPRVRSPLAHSCRPGRCSIAVRLATWTTPSPGERWRCGRASTSASANRTPSATPRSAVSRRQPPSADARSPDAWRCSARANTRSLRRGSPDRPMRRPSRTRSTRNGPADEPDPRIEGLLGAFAALVGGRWRDAVECVRSATDALDADEVAAGAGT